MVCVPLLVCITLLAVTIFDVLLQGNVAQQRTLDILSCTESRPFWVSWQSGLIQVGINTLNVLCLIMLQHCRHMVLVLLLCHPVKPLLL